jgi:hypothetical protein
VISRKERGEAGGRKGEGEEETVLDLKGTDILLCTSSCRVI